MAPPRLTDEQRKYNLEHKQVIKVGKHWIWQGAEHKGHTSRGSKDPKYGYSGYGVTRIRGKTILAHRYSYILFKGPIPKGCVIDQLCDIKLCVAPDCLEAKTQGQNVERYYNEHFGTPRKRTVKANTEGTLS